MIPTEPRQQKFSTAKQKVFVGSGFRYMSTARATFCGGILLKRYTQFY
jgi:hypothetical protein